MPPVPLFAEKNCMFINYEFKAGCHHLEEAESILRKYQPLFVGTDHQTDTYFMVSQGRLKLREWQIENALIHYHRSNTAAAKQSDVTLYQHRPDPALKEALTRALGVKVVVNKKRKIYFIDHVKFHFDVVDGLGTFLEVEAIDKDGTIGLTKLQEQCAFWAETLGVTENDYISYSYSDLLLAKKSSTL